MGTQLILTVGTNALPVWVAWHHLRKELEEPISVRFVHTDQTKSEMERLTSTIQADCPGTRFLTPIPIKPGEPHAVRSVIKSNVIDTLPQDCTHLHIHYTGGTKAMGVETVSIIEKEIASKGNVTLNASYLDPRGDHGPKIVSRTPLRVPDTRAGVKTDLSGIANLNGIEFISKPKGLAPDELEQGRVWLKAGWPGVEDPGDQLQNTAYRDFKNALGRKLSSSPKKGDLLEYGTYAAFEQALRYRKRDHWKLFHSAKGKRLARQGQRSNPRPFELDVVAVLGYQIVVVSCTATNPNTTEGQKTIKLKAMEALIRARQLGGDEAHAITLCRADYNACLDIEAGLEDEMGGESPHLKMWGKTKRGSLPKIDSLTHKFETYLNELSW